MKNYEPFDEPQESVFATVLKIALFAAFIFSVLMIIAWLVDMARHDVEGAAETIPAIAESSNPRAWDTHYRRADEIERRH